MLFGFKTEVRKSENNLLSNPKIVNPVELLTVVTLFNLDVR